MKLRIQIFLFFILVIGIKGANGQKIFREGFIIKNNGDTLIGLVQFEENQKINQKCIFKRFDIAINIVYTPEMIRAFGYKQGNYYERKELNGRKTFLECFVKGEISLYADGKKFYVEKNQNLIELKNSETRVTINNDDKVFSNHAQLLAYITLNGSGVSIPTNLKNDEKEIKPLIIQYNKSIKCSFIVYNRNFRKNIFEEATMLLGVNMRSFGLLNVIKQSKAVLNENPNSYFTSQNEYNQNRKVWSIGVFYNKKLSRMNNKFSVQVELLFSRSNFSFYQELIRKYPTETHRLDLFYYQTTIKLPIKIQYGIPFKKVTPFINAGLSYNYNIFSDGKGSFEAEKASNVIYTYNVKDFEKGYKFKTVSPFIGCGFKYNVLGSKFVIFEFRAEIEKGKYPNIAIDYNYSNSFKLKNDRPQFSIILGIGF